MNDLSFVSPSKIKAFLESSDREEWEIDCPYSWIFATYLQSEGKDIFDFEFDKLGVGWDKVLFYDDGVVGTKMLLDLPDWYRMYLMPFRYEKDKFIPKLALLKRLELFVKEEYEQKGLDGSEILQTDGDAGDGAR